MPKPSKAQITYTVNQQESVIRFHSVQTEEHEVSSVITKYPTQQGFVVSKHAIIANNVIRIVGDISNTPLIGTETFKQYGINNSKIVFASLKKLIREATPCIVQTNLGLYTPVIFTKLKTKQGAGSMDSASFQLQGEQVQIGSALSNTTPSLVVFNDITEAERETKVLELRSVGIDVPLSAVIQTGLTDFAGSFSLQTTGLAGLVATTVYEHVGFDPVAAKNSFMMHTSDILMAIAPITDTFDWRAESAILADAILNDLPDLLSFDGAVELGHELLAGSVGTIQRGAAGYINTAFGDLEESIYGGKYGLTALSSNAHLGQIVSALGVDDFVAGALGTASSAAIGLVDVLLGTEEAIEAATDIGNAAGIPVPAPVQLIKISAEQDSRAFFGDKNA